MIDPDPSRSCDWAQRQDEILADIISLMATCLEDGLSFEQAMGKVYERWHNDLASGFGRVLQEIQLGRFLNDALKDMSERLAKPDLTLFISAVIQADQGTEDLLEIVRAHAQRLRAKIEGNVA